MASTNLHLVSSALFGLLLAFTIIPSLSRSQETSTLADEFISHYTNGTNSSNATNNETCSGAKPCKDGLILPKWRPDGQISTMDKVARAAVYFLGMCYMFVGVSIISDRFMAAIEVIVSQTRTVKVKRKNGEVQIISVKIWNETVSNLTLMALGSSAPEILLSCIEICGNRFEAGDLGPGTIVGSAAYNLFVITGLCILVVSGGAVKRIKFLRVFFVTAAWSVFAYMWLYVIIAVSSPGIIEIWEGVFTFLCFPLTVLTSWMVDRKMLLGRFFRRKVRAQGGKKLTYTVDHDGKTVDEIAAEATEMQHMIEDGHTNRKEGDHITATSGATDADKTVLSRMTDEDLETLDQQQQELIRILRELRQRYPERPALELQEMAEVELVKRLPKSRGFYRMQATRRMVGAGAIIKREKVHERLMHEAPEEVNATARASEALLHKEDIQHVFFEPDFYAVMESIGAFQLTVTREGANLDNIVMVDYETADGTAEAGKDFTAAKGTLTFHPGEKHKQFSVEVIDDDVFEEDEHFYVKLLNVRPGDKFKDTVKVELGASQATVMILDDDHGGIFTFDTPEMIFPEDSGFAVIKVSRKSGARGAVTVPYATRIGSAIPGESYQIIEDGRLVFDDNQTEQEIHIPIVNESKYEKNDSFFVELGEPTWYLDLQAALRAVALSTAGHEPTADETRLSEQEREVANLGRPKLGETKLVKVFIRESEEFRKTIDKIANSTNVANQVSTSSWREQFIDAITVSAGDDDDDDDDDGGAEKPPKVPSWSDYVMHYITIFWKVLFAFVPPTDLCHGWLSFIFSLVMIGMLTAVIGDLASHLGCTIGLKDSLTSISFVALGTSLPDTFASKVAATKDQYADASIGNITGSNAVNVFLGIGVAWLIAAIYHAANGREFVVHPGSLAFSVTTFCSMAALAILVLLLRRLKPVGGELGGPPVIRYLSASFYFLLWVTYLVLSGLENYCLIPGF